MLMTMKELLAVAYENQFSIGAFNIGSGEILRLVLETAEEEKKAPAKKTAKKDE